MSNSKLQVLSTEDPPGIRLSEREWELIVLISLVAKSNKEIGFQMQITEGTVKEYLNRIFRKVGVATRGELALWAKSQFETED